MKPTLIVLLIKNGGRGRRECTGLSGRNVAREREGGGMGVSTFKGSSVHEKVEGGVEQEFNCNCEQSIEITHYLRTSPGNIHAMKIMSKDEPLSLLDRLDT